MKKIAFMVFITCVALVPPSAQASDFALGAVFGDPTGLSFRAGVSQKVHINSILGYGFFPGGGPTLCVDARFDLYDFLRKEKTVALWLNIGPGFSFHWFPSRYFYNRRERDERDRFGIGLHALFGLRLAWRTEPFEIIFDFSPFGIVSTTHAEVFYDFDIFFGFRYRF